MHPLPDQNVFSDLVAHAVTLGATEAVHIVSSEIRVNEKFATLCRDPGCPNYGLAASCPPNVEGPDAFRTWTKECADAIVVRMDVPADILYSCQRSEVMIVLHQIVSGIEHFAKAKGFSGSRGFAGGSCKELFCSSFPRCRQLNSEKGCRHPDTARPSMSGFGIDVGYLMSLAGWPEQQLGNPIEAKGSMLWLAGLVLVG